MNRGRERVAAEAGRPYIIRAGIGSPVAWTGKHGRVGMAHSIEIPLDADNPASPSRGEAIGRRRAIGRFAAVAALSLAGCVPQPNPNNPDELPAWSAYRLRRQRSGNRGEGGGRK